MTEFRTALDLAAAIRARQLSPTELMEATLSRIDERNPRLNAVIWLDEDDARERARVATDHISRHGTDDLPPFFGVPIPIKDLSTVAGWPATYGSTGASTEAADESGIVVRRLEEAGFVLCGRTNTPEFGTVTATENDRYGITRNPWDLDRTPGGSSGGASAAVAGGMFSIAHASDGGGSIRIPASCTGLVGLKASRGRIPDITVSWEGAATQGVVSHTVADTAAVLDAIGRPDPLAWWNVPAPARPFAEEVGADPGRLRVAVATDTPMGMPMDEACATAVARTVQTLADEGHEVVDATFDPHIDDFIPHFLNVINAGLAEYPVDWEAVQANNRSAYEQARAIDSLAYAASVAALQRWSRQVNAQWGRDFDLLVTPTMPMQPPPAGQVLREISEAPADTSLTVLRSVLFTSMFNMNGLPAISLPMHVAADTGLPIGVQLVAGPFDDATVLRVASQLEVATPWNRRHPDVAVLG